MGEIKDYVHMYIENSDILEEKTNEIAMNLQNNIKSVTPYDTGRLKRSIRVDSRIMRNYSIITGYWDEGLAPHGIFVLGGTKYMRARDFLGNGLKKTLALYGGN